MPAPKTDKAHAPAHGHAHAPAHPPAHAPAPAEKGHAPDEVKPESKATPDDSGAMLPTDPPSRAGEPENTYTTSPAGPGKPIDGSPAVNTYTPRAVQAAEAEAGAQDWQRAVATHGEPVELPEVQDPVAPKPVRPKPTK